MSVFLLFGSLLRSIYARYTQYYIGSRTCCITHSANRNRNIHSHYGSSHTFIYGEIDRDKSKRMGQDETIGRNTASNSNTIKIFRTEWSYIVEMNCSGDCGCVCVWVCRISCQILQLYTHANKHTRKMKNDSKHSQPIQIYHYFYVLYVWRIQIVIPLCVWLGVGE